MFILLFVYVILYHKNIRMYIEIYMIRAIILYVLPLSIFIQYYQQEIIFFSFRCVIS